MNITGKEILILTNFFYLIRSFYFIDKARTPISARIILYLIERIKDTTEKRLVKQFFIIPLLIRRGKGNLRIAEILYRRYGWSRESTMTIIREIRNSEQGV